MSVTRVPRQRSAMAEWQAAVAGWQAAMAVIVVLCSVIHQTQGQQSNSDQFSRLTSADLRALQSIKRNPFPTASQQPFFRPEPQPRPLPPPPQEQNTPIRQQNNPLRQQNPMSSTFDFQLTDPLSSLVTNDFSFAPPRLQFPDFLSMPPAGGGLRGPPPPAGSGPFGAFGQTAETFSSFGPPRLFPQTSDVSPFWADPEGRPPPQPPFISPEDLTITHLPCVQNASIAPCDSFNPYRRMDGACNNLRHPTFGMSSTVLQRMFRHPADPAMMRRVAMAGDLLPNPRVISEAMRHVRPKPTQRHTNLMFMVLGQFIDHDIVSIPVAQDPQQPGTTLRCGACDSWRRHAGCAPIPIPVGDAFFRGAGRPSCLPFTRSVGIPIRGSSGRRYLENINLNSAYLDLSTVYGSHDCINTRLRTYDGGRLLTTHLPGSPHGLPILTPRNHFMNCRTRFQQCYLAGDDRSNEHIALLSIHTTFLREHNHLAAELRRVNPAWDDEKLFQESRRLNIAQYQHIIVNEFLPRLLGEHPLLRHYGLLPNPGAFPVDAYQPQSNGQILQEFAGAAFRVGHTLVPDHFVLSDAELRPVSSIPLASVFHDPSVMQKDLKGTMHDHLTRGLVSTKLEGADLRLVDALRDELYATKGAKFSGQDLFAINIARGRDHGLAPYTAYRATCQLPPVRRWEDLSPLMPPHHVARLRTVYRHWDDVDLFTGGLAEDVVYGGLVGPTFACIIALQFYILKVSDRFWYDGIHQGLSPPELSSVQQFGQLARLISRNLDDPDSLVPRSALALPNVRSNPPVVAAELTSMDLRPWVSLEPSRPKSCHYKGRDYPEGALVPVSPCLLCQCTGDAMLHCDEQSLDCGVLEQFVPEARHDEYCYRLCPFASPQLSQGQAPFHSPLRPPPPPGPLLYQVPFFSTRSRSSSENPML